MKKLFLLFLVVVFIAGCSNSKSSNSSSNSIQVSGSIDFSVQYFDYMTVQFTSVLQGIDSSNAAYKWEFGDGVTSSEQHPRKKYEKEGNYTVKLTVRTNSGAVYNIEKEINVANTVSVNVKISNGEIFGSTVSFTSEVSGLHTDDNIIYSWNFGNEDLNNSAGAAEISPVVTYKELGKYNVTLTVTVNDIKYKSNSLEINITQLSGVMINAEYISNDNIKFTAAVNGLTYDKISYNWSFGGIVNEDNMSTEASPSVIYKHGGTYKVVLNAVIDGTNYTAEESVLVKKIKMYGYNGVLFLAKSDGLYSWGSNYYGQTGTGQNAEGVTNVMLPKKVKNIDITADKVKDIVFVNNSVFCLLESGKLYSWGDNSNGILGQGKETGVDVFEPELIMDNITNISYAGTYFASMLAVTNDGSLFSWGSNMYKTLGYIPEGSSVNVPTKIETLKDVVNVTGGFQSAYAVTGSGAVYSWGQNMYGSLGLGLGTTGMAVQETPAQVTGNNFSNILIKEIKTIDNSVYAISDNGDLYSWGLNDYGKLGISMDYTPYGAADVPYKVEFDSNRTVKKLYNLNKTTYAVTNDGKIYSWGHNGIWGKLGTGNSNTLMPTPVMIAGENNYLTYSQRQIVDVALKENSTDRAHVLIVTEDGRLYSWGDNETGQLGLANKVASNVQTSALRVDSVISKEKILKTYTSYSSSYAVSENKILYTWGDNSTGQLGGRTGINSAPRETSVGENVIDVFLLTDTASSLNTSVFAITDNETVYSFGYHNKYILGINNANTIVKQPKRINF